MPFFEDLSAYTYGFGWPEHGSVNIAWLARRMPYQTGSTSPEFQYKLALLCAQAGMQRYGSRGVRTIRHTGYHTCDLCDRGSQRPVCTTEVRLRSADRVYVAPQMILHYVLAHRYQPPEEFVIAVLSWNGEVFEG